MIEGTGVVMRSSDDVNEFEEATIQEKERWGIDVSEPEDCSGSQEEVSKWHPTAAELESLAIASVGGMTASDLARKFGKSYKQIRYQLKGEKFKAIAKHVQNVAIDHAGFAMAQLQLGAPTSAANLLAICNDTQNPRHFDALKYHLETVLRSQVQSPDQGVNVHLNITQQAATMIAHAVPNMKEARGEQRVEHPSNNSHLHHGNKIAEARKVELRTEVEDSSDAD